MRTVEEQAARTVQARMLAIELKAWLRVALVMLDSVQEGPEGTYHRQLVARLIRSKVAL